MSKMIELGISPTSQRKFERLTREMSTMVSADMPVVVKNAAKDVAFQLVKVTPIGKGLTRGFAKSGWGVAMVGLGISPNAFFFKNSGARAARWPEFGSYADKLRGVSPSVELTNEVPYIEEMKGSSQVLPHAFHNASRLYEKRLTGMGRKMAGKWAR